MEPESERHLKNETRLRYHDYAFDQDRWNCVAAALVIMGGMALLYVVVGVLIPKLFHR